MGLLYIDSDAPAGSYDIHINRPSGESVTLTLDVVTSLAATAIETHKVAIPGRPERPGVPDILLQQPVSPLPLNSARLRRLGLPVDASSAKFAPFPAYQVCGWISRRQRWSFSSVLLSLTNPVGQPITKAMLDHLVPGQRLHFNSTTVAVEGHVEFTFFFKICNNWVTTVLYCFKAGVSYMVPLVGGYSIE